MSYFSKIPPSKSLDIKTFPSKIKFSLFNLLRDGPFDTRGGGGGKAVIFFFLNSLFPYRSEKNKMYSTKLKI